GCESPYRQRKVLYGAQAVPSGRDFSGADEVQAGAKAYAAGISLYRPGAEHGTDRGVQRGKSQDPGGSAGDRVQKARGIYGADTEDLRYDLRSGWKLVNDS